jgi:hypothetical protein
LQQSRTCGGCDSDSGWPTCRAIAALRKPFETNAGVVGSDILLHNGVCLRDGRGGRIHAMQICETDRENK